MNDGHGIGTWSATEERIHDVLEKDVRELSGDYKAAETMSGHFT